MLLLPAQQARDFLRQRFMIAPGVGEEIVLSKAHARADSNTNAIRNLLEAHTPEGKGGTCTPPMLNGDIVGLRFMANSASTVGQYSLSRMPENLSSDASLLVFSNSSAELHKRTRRLWEERPTRQTLLALRAKTSHAQLEDHLTICNDVQFLKTNPATSLLCLTDEDPGSWLPGSQRYVL
eukprot:2531600-Rhodomonas_salina.2